MKISLLESDLNKEIRKTRRQIKRLKTRVCLQRVRASFGRLWQKETTYLQGKINSLKQEITSMEKESQELTFHRLYLRD